MGRRTRILRLLRLLLLFLLLIFFPTGGAYARSVRYDLTATLGAVNLSGQKSVDFAILLNGSIPAPTLEFTEGDEAEIVVRNRIPNQELSLHWHGILLPPEMDGVPYVTTPPIHSGHDRTFRFQLRQHGTYWYHSHTHLQEQKGVYGAFIIHPKKPELVADREAVVVLSDWSDENPDDILRNLRKDGDYYLYKKGTLQSWYGALKARSFGNYLQNQWLRMGGMDLSDVGYDAFLINGKRNSQLLAARPGEKIRLRIINAASSTYFYLALGQLPMRVIAVDGVEIDPIAAKEILAGMAETYDVLFEVPASKNYEFKITAQDGSGSASAWIGAGERVFAPQRPMPNPYEAMGQHAHGAHPSHAGHEKVPGHAQHYSHSSAIRSVDVLRVDAVKAREKTDFLGLGNVKVFARKMVLGGDMQRYVWHIDGKTIADERDLTIDAGDVVQLTFENTTMMHHPLHLHGHFFRVLNEFGAYSPLKHTVDVPPHGSQTIEFLADAPGEWMLHCHNLYHLKTGMGRVVKYRNYVPSIEMLHFQQHDPHAHDHGYFSGQVEVATNHARMDLRLSQTWNQVDARIEARRVTPGLLPLGGTWAPEADLFYRRWVSAHFYLLAGGIFWQKQGSLAAGVGYLLPFLVESKVLLSHRGDVRVGLGKRLQWTKAWFSDVDLTWRPKLRHLAREQFEYDVSLLYGPGWAWAGGLMLTNASVGAGLRWQF